MSARFRLASSVLFWAPRILTLLFAVFLAMLALDVFEQPLGLRSTLAALLLHLIPTVVVLAFLAAAWRRPWVGAAVYLALGVLFLVATGGRAPWPTYAAITGTLSLIGALFLIDWLHRPRPLSPV